MSIEEKSLARVYFRLKIKSSDGNAFEDLFTQIMSYAEEDFCQIKPWGNIGDRKNDGYIKTKGIFFQVFAPEDIRKTYPEVVSKLEGDFTGLISQWSPIKEFYFVVNDKYKGINADSEKAISQIVKNNSLNNGSILTAPYLERRLFELADDQIFLITGNLPNLEYVSRIDFSVLTEVVGYIMQLPIVHGSGQIKFPDWDEKIAFNKMSPEVKHHLDNGSYNLGALDEFLSNEGNFLAEQLQQKLVGLYDDLKMQYPLSKDEYSGDCLFWEMVYNCMPKRENCYFSSVVTVIAKYFESCDIFEEPIKK